MNRVFGRIKQTNDQVGILNFGISDFDAFFSISSSASRNPAVSVK